MGTKIIFTTAKGGTGKSTFLTFLANWFQGEGINPYLIDADEESRTFSKRFATAHQIESLRSKALDVVMNIAEKGDEPLILLDMKGGVGSMMVDWFSILPFSELLNLNISFLCIGMLTSSPASVHAFFRWVDVLGSQVRYLVVRNLKDSDTVGIDPEKVILPAYDESKPGREFVRRYKPATIVMKGLDPEYQSELERVGMTIRDVLERNPNVPDSLSSLIVRAKLRHYQAHLFDQFIEHRELLLP